MGRSALRAYESLTSQECYHERADGRGLFFGQSVNPGNEPKNPAQYQFILLDPLFLGIPVEARYGLTKRPPRRGRWRPSHSVKRPDCLRRLAPQSRFVAAHAVKQGRVKIGEAQETLGDGSGLRAWSERRTHGRRRRRFLVAGRRMVSSVRAGAFTMAIGLRGRCERPRLTGTAGGVLPAREQKFALDLKESRFDRAGTPKSPQQAC